MKAEAPSAKPLMPIVRGRVAQVSGAYSYVSQKQRDMGHPKLNISPSSY